MRIIDDKLLFHCNTCELFFYDQVKESAQCPDCNKSVAPFRNLLDRHREECPECKKVFEVTKKSPYENAHFLNCDSCMTVLKISYSDSLLQKYISNIAPNNFLGDTQIRNYWHEVEEHLGKCLCGGEFKHTNPRKCPYCLADIDSIPFEYMIINNYREKVSIPIITKHIWKNTDENSNKNILPEETEDPFLQTLIHYMKTMKYFQEIHYENKGVWADSPQDLESYARVENLSTHYSFTENHDLLEKYFQFAFEIFPDNYHLIAFPVTDKIKSSYLLQGKTGEIEIHPVTYF